MKLRTRLTTAAVLAIALAGCRGTGDIVVDEGVGITAVRTACPAVGVPDYTGDITLFRTPGVTTADNIDLVAALTNVRNTCNDSGDKVYATATFDVLARRTDTRGARSVTVPYFVTVLRGGTAVISKRVGEVTLNFADGQERASASGAGSAYIDKAEATIPAESANRSPASARRAMPMRRSIRCRGPRSRRLSPALPSKCWWASSCRRIS